MRRLTEYEQARALNDILLHLWWRYAVQLLKKSRGMVPVEYYEEYKNLVDNHEAAYEMTPSDILTVINEIKKATSEATMDDFGTWRDVYEYWERIIDDIVKV